MSEMTASANGEQASTELAAIPNQRPATSAVQAKVEAVANLTMSAYGRASTLQMSAEEKSRLLASFPDEAFRGGAGGKEHFLYIEHAYLRSRLNDVFGPGQWAVIPRSRWSEDFVTLKNVEGIIIYVEAMLVIRGCFVAEAVGSMEYYPSNMQANYADAVEGAKTAALRRCMKELGVGLQAWEKSFTEGWHERKKQARRAASVSGVVVPAAGGESSESAPKEGEPVPVAGTVGEAKTLQDSLAQEKESHRPTAADMYAQASADLVSARNSYFELKGLPASDANKADREGLWSKIIAKRNARATSELTLPQILELLSSLHAKIDEMVKAKIAAESCVDKSAAPKEGGEAVAAAPKST